MSDSVGWLVAPRLSVRLQLAREFEIAGSNSLDEPPTAVNDMCCAPLGARIVPETGRDALTQQIKLHSIGVVTRLIGRYMTT